MPVSIVLKNGKIVTIPRGHEVKLGEGRSLPDVGTDATQGKPRAVEVRGDNGAVLGIFLLDIVAGYFHHDEPEAPVAPAE